MLVWRKAPSSKNIQVPYPVQSVFICLSFNLNTDTADAFVKSPVTAYTEVWTIFYLLYPNLRASYEEPYGTAPGYPAITNTIR